MLLLTLKPKRKINQNDLAWEICKLEGGKKQMDIAQVKECLKCTLDTLRVEWKTNPRGVKELLSARL